MAETLDPKIEKNAVVRPFAVLQKEQSKWVGLHCNPGFSRKADSANR